MSEKNIRTKRAVFGKNRAIFPPGYAIPFVFRPLFLPATLSRRFRRFFIELPHSRVRTFFVAQYYHRVVRQLQDGDFGFLRAVEADAELTLFSVETHRGPEGWRAALSGWRDSFAGRPVFELAECVDARSLVLLTVRLGGQGGSSGVVIEDFAYFVITARKGMAARCRLFRDREEALEAAGPSN